MSLNYFLFIIIFIVSFLIGCQFEVVLLVVSFYYWKLVFKFSFIEWEWLEVYKVKCFYVKYFDVDVENGQAVFKVFVWFVDFIYKNFEIVFCIFIINCIFQVVVNLEDLVEWVWKYL